MAIVENNQAVPSSHPLRAAAGRALLGYAEAQVEGQLVRYSRDGGFDGFSYDHPMPSGADEPAIMEAVILEIAAGRGQAQGQPFSARFADRMIDTRRVANANFPKKHAEAKAVEDLMRRRPDLFYS